MKVGLGRALLGLGLLVGARALAAQKPASGEPSVRFVLKFDGGVAYVFSAAGGRADVGPVARPAGAGARTESFNPHPMSLEMEWEEGKGPSGKAQDHPQWPHPREAGGTKWPLAGYEVWPCPDGVCPSASRLTSSPDEGPDPSAPCKPPHRTPGDLSVPAVDNLYYLPDLLALHPSTGPPADWHRRLDGRVVLKAGKLIVVDTFNCVEFRSATVNRRQAVTSGMAGVHYTLSARKYVDLLFKELSTGAITGALRLVPPTGGHEIKMLLKMPDPPGSEHSLTNGQSLTDYQQFYELLPGVPVGNRIDARYQPEGNPGLSPGQECGSVRLGPGPAVTAEAR